MELACRISRESFGTLASPFTARATAPWSPIELRDKSSCVSCATLRRPLSASASASAGPRELLQSRRRSSCGILGSTRSTNVLTPSGATRVSEMSSAVSALSSRSRTSRPCAEPSGAAISQMRRPRARMARAGADFSGKSQGAPAGMVAGVGESDVRPLEPSRKEPATWCLSGRYLGAFCEASPALQGSCLLAKLCMEYLSCASPAHGCA
eukprot:scaffold697_cov235-Pinguiococcus_pyrenoidosus.AAC.5